MQNSKQTPKAVSEETWSKVHAAFIEPTKPRDADKAATLPVLCRRFRVPLAEAERRASMEEWEAERDAVEARAFFDDYARGIKTEVAYCLHYASQMTPILGKDLGAVGGEELLQKCIADARVIWRRRMGKILLWEAMQASDRYGPQQSAV